MSTRNEFDMWHKVGQRLLLNLKSNNVGLPTAVTYSKINEGGAQILNQFDSACPLEFLLN